MTYDPLPHYLMPTRADPRRLDRQRLAIANFNRTFERWERHPPPAAVLEPVHDYARRLWRELEAIALGVEAHKREARGEWVMGSVPLRPPSSLFPPPGFERGALTTYCDGLPLSMRPTP